MHDIKIISVPDIDRMRWVKALYRKKLEDVSLWLRQTAQSDDEGAQCLIKEIEQTLEKDGMRFLADDDKVFDTAEECQDHEVTLQAVKAQSAAIQAFLTETAAKDESPTSRTRRENVVAAYVAWSARQEAGDRVVRALVG